MPITQDTGIGDLLERYSDLVEMSTSGWPPPA